ncbi:bifunctional phosphopantothenoylcysteine decarboxylase/phosphopantothenate--cysteine ligase CoaBC [Curvivirga aplysinae]|uniref:bifunctional phosphopantothenoylcysteine decarboxylase/phosphopantothenate--cysteine ligase CoaBC n=1 Tax=Curvivirga aplysinae TaxID=2529852 RepID=UPI0012BC1958|nr:bifunctional phosphopantothenoylcysteine decarboxylase/phosphopantothenate--cysteine ligase CoaBC [Curvivirga aplysinae]MTI10446.1 bifunctional phosphopantothenoylcysteine decarboxylase/phosphopantothenate--cysteine ligase CoaBC [Curvivirga aplysinae]
MNKTRKILLIVSGGIAAYKTLSLIRLLRENEFQVRVVMTKAAEQFVTPLSLASLSEDKVYTDLFSLTDEAEMGHIQLSRDADLLLVVPASADLMSKMANGMCNDLASTVLLATDKPVMIAPAMNVRMWHHPATQDNFAKLKSRDVKVIGPVEGVMACGEYGLGRMVEPEEILEVVKTHFEEVANSKQPLLIGRKVLVTSGPTHEPIDPVRYIANRSSGRQGHAIATALQKAGAEVTLVSGPTRLADPVGVKVIHVESACAMLDACQENGRFDVAVFAAAVADWRVKNAGAQKTKKENGKLPVLEFAENPDILKTVSNAGNDRPELVVGFAAETENVVEYASAKRIRKSCDWILANDVSPETGTFGGEKNSIHFIHSAGVESWEEMSKQAVAERLVEKVVAYFNG